MWLSRNEYAIACVLLNGIQAWGAKGSWCKGMALRLLRLWPARQTRRRPKPVQTTGFGRLKRHDVIDINVEPGFAELGRKLVDFLNLALVVPARHALELGTIALLSSYGHASVPLGAVRVAPSGLLGVCGRFVGLLVGAR